MRKRFEALGLVLAAVLVWSAYPHMPLLAYWLCHVAFAFLVMLLVYGVLLEGHFAGPCMVLLFVVGLFGECLELILGSPGSLEMDEVAVLTAPWDIAFEMLGGLMALLIVRARRRLEVRSEEGVDSHRTAARYVGNMGDLPVHAASGELGMPSDVPVPADTAGVRRAGD